MIENLSVTWEGIGIGIAAVFSIISLIGQVINYFSEKRKRKKDHQITYVTDKRLEWIYEVRNTISEYVAVSNKIADDKKYSGVESIELMHTANMLSCKIRLLLNFSDDLDFEILKIINYICANNSEVSKYDEVIDKIGILTDLFQVYFKYEWERIKLEVNDEKITEKWKRKKIVTLLDKRINSNVSTKVKAELEEVKKSIDE